MRAVFGLVELDEGRSGGTVRRSAPRTGPGSATCRRSGACIRGCGCGTS
jgi:hypothetical protein